MSNLSGKQIGKNIIVLDGDTKYSKMFDSAEDRKEILAQIAKYNEAHKPELKEEILSKMQKNVLEKKKAVADVIESIQVHKEVVVEKADKRKDEINLIAALSTKSDEEGLTDSEINDLELLLKKYKKEEVVKPKPTYGTSRRGEY